MKSLSLPLEMNPLPRLARVPDAAVAAPLTPFFLTARRRSSEGNAGAIRAGGARQILHPLREKTRWEHAAFVLVTAAAALPLIYGLMATASFSMDFGKLLDWVRTWGL